MMSLHVFKWIMIALLCATGLTMVMAANDENKEAPERLSELSGTLRRYVPKPHEKAMA